MYLPFDELNNLLEKYDMPFLDAKSTSADEVIDEVYELLVLALVYGINNVNESLGTSVELPTETTEGILFHKTEGKSFDERIREYVENADENGKVIVGGVREDVFKAISRVMETEVTRIFNETMVTAAVEAEKKDGKRSVSKTWVTMGDEKVRDTHFFSRRHDDPRQRLVLDDRRRLGTRPRRIHEGTEQRELPLLAEIQLGITRFNP